MGAFANQIPIQSDHEAQPYTFHQNQHHPNYSIRIREQQNDTICDARSKQYTGWLDVGASKHLFFWFFESQTSPGEDPLVLWLNGGPGGSSMMGLFQELGPCLVNECGNATVHNPFGWSKSANLLFIDQPAGVGFSYFEDKEQLLATNSLDAAKDMHKFLQIFLSQAFPWLKDAPLHLGGESYAGHYVPVLGAYILSQNALYPHRLQISLASIFVGNAWLSPLDTRHGYWQTLCTTNPGVTQPVVNETRCDTIASNMPRCLYLSQICYNNPDPVICEAANQFCWDGIDAYFDSEAGPGGRNIYDITTPCDVEDLCYNSSVAVTTYLNSPDVYKALNIPRQYVPKFELASVEVGDAFYTTIDPRISMEAHVLHLLESGIDVMFYNGNLDLACNTAGNLQWANNVMWQGQPEFSSRRMKPWGKSDSGKSFGSFKDVRIQLPSRAKPVRFSL